MYKVAVIDYLNHCDFIIVLQSKDDAEKAKEYALAGLSAWYSAAVSPGEIIEGDDYFTADEIESFYDLGYAEPTEILLDRAGIQYEIKDMLFDEEEDVIISAYDDYVCY